MPKRKLIENALLEAEELEKASIENAKELIFESFTPSFKDLFAVVLNEAEEENFKDDEDVPDDEELDDEELEEGNEHDVGKEPDSGRQGTDPAVDDSEENLPQDQKDDPMKEGKFDAVSGDPTPEKGQAGLPKKNQPKTKKVGDKGWEDEGTAGFDAEDPEKAPGDMPGNKPAVKQTGGGWEDEGSADAATPAPREELKGVPKPPVKIVEADDDEKDDEEDKELDVPDELFDDSDNGTEGTDKDDEVDIKDDFDGNDDDVEIDIDIDDDDDDKDDVKEGVDIDIEDKDDDESEDEEEDPDDEEIEEGLYVRSEGEFKKITPAEYLQTRINTLEEELEFAVSTIETLQGQLQETHVFNAKLAHHNKLMLTGAFTNSEKERIAERFDDCEDIDDVKSLYKSIIREIQDKNPLDDFSNLIKEVRTNAGSKTENIYESKEIARMKKLIDY